MGIIVYYVVFVQLSGRQIGLILRSAGREQKSTCASSMWRIPSLAWSAPVCCCFISLWSPSNHICLQPKNIGSIILISHEILPIPYIFLMVALCDCICGGATHWWRDLVYVIGVFECIQMTEALSLSGAPVLHCTWRHTRPVRAHPGLYLNSFSWPVHVFVIFFFFFIFYLQPRTAFENFKCNRK